VTTKIAASRIDELAYERLRDAILDGTFTPGQPLVEARLASEYGISKTPVREALIRLQRDGLVQLESYRGARVTRLVEEDVRAICDMRRALEGHIAKSLSTAQPAVVLRWLKRNIDDSFTAFGASDYEKVQRLIAQFTDLMATGHGNPCMIKTLDGLRSLLDLIGSASRLEPDRIQRSINEHKRIYDAIVAGDGEAAATAAFEHIDSVEADRVSHLDAAAVRG
jgi:DNA-binding GntR family transcriptional regulator